VQTEVKIIQKIKRHRIKRNTSKLLESTGENYAKLFNKKAALSSVSARVIWNGQEYCVYDSEMPDKTYIFRHEKQGHLSYKRGLKSRAVKLGEDYFLEQIEFEKGDTVLDCGANLGDLLLWFSLKNLDINYVGFEPSPVEHACATRNVAPHPVHNVGLWNKDDLVEFYLSSQGADSSFIEPALYDDKITIQTRRLYSFVGKPVRLLKLEAEGAEPEILEGVGDRLANIEYISADLGFERGKTAESTLVPVVNYLLSNEFELIDVAHKRICALFKNKAYTG
tara:strand:- start:457 stop:1296 length:840 start_codon:yes stop_codon:yes gene_type:complete